MVITMMIVFTMVMMIVIVIMIMVTIVNTIIWTADVANRTPDLDARWSCR
jgi:hypothetical protein